MLKVLHIWERSHITKIIGSGFAYNAWSVISIIPYDFGKKKVNIIKCVCKSMLITHRFVSQSIWVPRGDVHMSGPTGDYVTNWHNLIWYQSRRWFLDMMWFTCKRKCWKYMYASQCSLPVSCGLKPPVSCGLKPPISASTRVANKVFMWRIVTA